MRKASIKKHITLRSPKNWMKIEDRYSVLVISYQRWIYTGYASMKVRIIKRWPPKTVLRRYGWRK